MTYKQRLQYTLDVLTDGSEYTGHGTIFLSITRKSAYTTKPSHQLKHDDKVQENDVDEDDMQAQDGTILARYALTGLCTLTARLAADQAYKLSQVKALLLPYRSDVVSTAGISSLLLSLSNYSLSGKLHVVGPVGTNDFMEELSTLILGPRREYPKVTVCELPPSSNKQDKTTTSWWKVYEDDYILVHARSLLTSILNICHQNHEAVIYIVTMGNCNDTDSRYIEREDKLSSFVICPPYLDMTKFTSKILEPLPDVIRQSNTLPFPNCMEIPTSMKSLPLQFFILCNPFLDKLLKMDVESNSMMRIPIHTSLFTLTNKFLITIPNNYSNSDNGQWDHGLLIRAVHQSFKLHSSIPSTFPLRLVYIDPTPISKTYLNQTDKETSVFSPSWKPTDADYIDWLCYKLYSCTSIVMNSTNFYSSSLELNQNAFRLIDRRMYIWNKVKSEIQNTDCNNVNSDTQKPLSRCRTQQDPKLRRYHTPQDPNEIDLDLDDDDSYAEKRPKLMEGSKHRPVGKECNPVQEYNSLNDERGKVSQILVLGTGSAAPAPLRGSSGYALFTPSTISPSFSSPSLGLTSLIECGEGCLTSLSRFVPPHSTQNFQIQLSSLEWVWISHAHLDHYGELPTLIHYLNLIRVAPCQCFQEIGMCRSKSLPPLSEGGHRLCSKCNKVLPLIVIAPAKVLRYVDLVLCTVNGISHNNSTISYKRLFLGLSHQQFDLSPHIQNTYLGVDVGYKRRIKIRSIQVQHCAHSYALILGFECPDARFTLCYSGDTRPCQRLAQACRDEGANITLLIHEATFDDDQPMDALKKSHCTVSEALRIFQSSCAESCVLSHFSQRYPRLPPAASPSFSSVSYSMASDGMLIPLDSYMLAKLSNVIACYWASQNTE